MHGLILATFTIVLEFHADPGIDEYKIFYGPDTNVTQLVTVTSDGTDIVQTFGGVTGDQFCWANQPVSGAVEGPRSPVTCMPLKKNLRPASLKSVDVIEN